MSLRIFSSYTNSKVHKTVKRDAPFAALSRELEKENFMQMCRRAGMDASYADSANEFPLLAGPRLGRLKPQLQLGLPTWAGK